MGQGAGVASLRVLSPRACLHMLQYVKHSLTFTTVQQSTLSSEQVLHTSFISLALHLQYPYYSIVQHLLLVGSRRASAHGYSTRSLGWPSSKVLFLQCSGLCTTCCISRRMLAFRLLRSARAYSSLPGVLRRTVASAGRQPLFFSEGVSKLQWRTPSATS